MKIILLLLMLFGGEVQALESTDFHRLPSRYPALSGACRSCAPYLEYSWLVALKGQIGAVEDAGRSLAELSLSEIQGLENLANLGTDAGIARWKARSILNFFYGYNFEDQPILPELAPALRTMQTDSIEQIAKEEQIITIPQLTINPNPAKSWVKFAYSLVSSENINLSISDVNAKTLYTTELVGSIGDFVWEIPHQFPSGVYFVVIRGKGLAPLSSRFTVIR